MYLSSRGIRAQSHVPAPDLLFGSLGGSQAVIYACNYSWPSVTVGGYIRLRLLLLLLCCYSILDYRCFEASDLLPYATRETLEELGLLGYQIDTFLSDYDYDHIVESGMVYDAHGA